MNNYLSIFQFENNAVRVTTDNLTVKAPKGIELNVAGNTLVYGNSKNGNIQTGRMSRYEWMKHYKLIESIPGLDPTPIPVVSMGELNLDKDCCKLITLKNVEIAAADGKAVFAPDDGSVTLTSNCANRDIKGLNKVVVRTSTYAKFANTVMPTGKVNITGIASRFGAT